MAKKIPWDKAKPKKKAPKKQPKVSSPGGSYFRNKKDKMRELDNIFK